MAEKRPGFVGLLSKRRGGSPTPAQIYPRVSGQSFLLQGLQIDAGPFVKVEALSILKLAFVARGACLQLLPQQ